MHHGVLIIMRIIMRGTEREREISSACSGTVCATQEPYKEKNIDTYWGFICLDWVNVGFG